MEGFFVNDFVNVPYGPCNSPNLYISGTIAGNRQTKILHKNAITINFNDSAMAIVTAFITTIIVQWETNKAP